MANHKQVFINTDILHRARAALEELATIRRQQIEASGDDPEGKNHDALMLAREMEDASRDIGHTLRDLGQQMSRDEELEALDRSLAKLSKAAGYGTGGDRAKKLESYAQSILRDRDRAYSTFATFAHEMRVQVNALMWIAQSMLHAGTHREKANVLGVLLEAFRALEQSIIKVDGDPSMYDLFSSHYDHNEGSWSFRDLLADKKHLEHKLERVQGEWLRLKNKYEANEEADQPEPPSYNGIPF